MKKKPLLVLFLLLCFIASEAQNNNVPFCIDSIVTKTSDSIIRSFRSQSLSLLHTASLTMESEYESGIIVDLKKGNSYVLVFVGAKTSKLFQVTMFDWQEERVAFAKQKAFDKEGNILMFTYEPRASGLHMIKPLQSNKKNKTICGQMILFKKDLP